MHTDHQGSTLARTDIYGTVTKGYAYNSFGVPANQGFDPYHYTVAVFRSGMKKGVTVLP